MIRAATALFRYVLHTIKDRNLLTCLVSYPKAVMPPHGRTVISIQQHEYVVEQEGCTEKVEDTADGSREGVILRVLWQ